MIKSTRNRCLPPRLAGFSRRCALPGGGRARCLRAVCPGRRIFPTSSRPPLRSPTAKAGGPGNTPSSFLLARGEMMPVKVHDGRNGLVKPLQRCTGSPFRQAYTKILDSGLKEAGGEQPHHQRGERIVASEVATTEEFDIIGRALRPRMSRGAGCGGERRQSRSGNCRQTPSVPSP